MSLEPVQISTTTLVVPAARKLALDFPKAALGLASLRLSVLESRFELAANQISQAEQLAKSLNEKSEQFTRTFHARLSKIHEAYEKRLSGKESTKKTESRKEVSAEQLIGAQIVGSDSVRNKDLRSAAANLHPDRSCGDTSASYARVIDAKARLGEGVALWTTDLFSIQQGELVAFRRSFNDFSEQVPASSVADFCVQLEEFSERVNKSKTLDVLDPKKIAAKLEREVESSRYIRACEQIEDIVSFVMYELFTAAGMGSANAQVAAGLMYAQCSDLKPADSVLRKAAQSGLKEIDEAFLSFAERLDQIFSSEKNVVDKFRRISAELKELFELVTKVAAASDLIESFLNFDHSKIVPNKFIVKFGEIINKNKY